MNDSRRHSSVPRCSVATNSSHRALNWRSQRVSTVALFPLLEERESSGCTNTYTRVHTHSWLASRREWMQYVWALMALTFFPFSAKPKLSPFDEWLWLNIIDDRERETRRYAPHARTHVTTHTSKRLCVYACRPALPAVNDLDRI